MSSTLATAREGGLIERIGQLTLDGISAVGGIALFFLDLLAWLMTRLPRRPVLLACMYQIGVESLLVVMVTGGFIGMVMAVQSYDAFYFMHLETDLGAVINIPMLNGLGTELAAQ